LTFERSNGPEELREERLGSGCQVCWAGLTACCPPPDVARRLHAAEQALRSDDVQVRDAAVRERAGQSACLGKEVADRRTGR